MIEILNKLTGWLKLVGPLIIFITTLLATASMIRWGKKTKVAFKEIFSEPGNVIFFIILLGLGLFFWFKLISPYLGGK